MKKIVVKGNVGYVDAFDKIYFNSDHPENQTIKKVRKKENLVDIYKGNGIWEKQFVDIAFGILNKNIEKYHRKIHSKAYSFFCKHDRNLGIYS
jgi:hypothetical protein